MKAPNAPTVKRETEESWDHDLRPEGGFICSTRPSDLPQLATISSGLYRFLAITVLLDVSSRATSMGPDQKPDR